MHFHIINDLPELFSLNSCIHLIYIFIFLQMYLIYSISLI